MRPKQVIQLTARHKGLHRLLYSLGGTIATSYACQENSFVGFLERGNFFVVLPRNLNEKEKEEQLARGLAVLYECQPDCEQWDEFASGQTLHSLGGYDEYFMTQLFLFLGAVIEAGRIDEEKVLDICRDRKKFRALLEGAWANMEDNDDDECYEIHDALEESLASMIS